MKSQAQLERGRFQGENGAWNKITQRIRRNPEYVALFQKSQTNIKRANDIEFTDIANAIAEFIAYEWQAIESPFDAYLAGKKDALTPEMISGMHLFYGKAGCSSCHGRALQTDHNFHAIAIPQFGPGITARFESKQNDTGR